MLKQEVIELGLSHGHDHEHHAGCGGHCHHPEADAKRLGIAFLLVVSMMVVEFVVGWISGSLALTSDAAHMLADGLALGGAFLASLIAHKRPKAKIYAALINGIILLIMASFIFKCSLDRVIQPRQIHCEMMMITAAVGLIVNILQVMILWGGCREDINMRGAYYHVIGDTLSSVGVILGGLLIYYLGLNPIDPIIGFIIGRTVLWYGFILTKDSIFLFRKDG